MNSTVPAVAACFGLAMSALVGFRVGLSVGERNGIDSEIRAHARVDAVRVEPDYDRIPFDDVAPEAWCTTEEIFAQYKCSGTLHLEIAEGGATIGCEHYTDSEWFIADQGPCMEPIRGSSDYADQCIYFCPGLGSAMWRDKTCGCVPWEDPIL